MKIVDIDKSFNIDIKEITEFELKDENLRKVATLMDGQSEGFWAYFSDDDVKKYDEDVKDGISIVVAANATLCGIPWGAYFPVEFKGTERPFCDMTKLINLDTIPVIHSECIRKYKEQESNNDE